MNPAKPVRRGWVLYDGDCRLCAGSVARLGPMLRRRGFDLTPLQTHWVCDQFGWSADEIPDEMKLLHADGQVLGGAEALLQIARTIWWAWPLYALAQLPGGKAGARFLYRRLAANRHHFVGVCTISEAIPRHHTIRTFLEMP